MQQTLDRHVGRYFVGTELQDGREIHRFLEVKVVDDHLEVENLVVTAPVGAGLSSGDRSTMEHRTEEAPSPDASVRSQLRRDRSSAQPSLARRTREHSRASRRGP